MGQIVKQVSVNTTRYYWYPGDRREWLRGASAVGLGIAGFVLLRTLMRDALPAAVIGTSLTAALAGLNFGRRDSRELARFTAVAEKAARARRQAAVVHTGRAVWRGFAMGTGGAAAAVLIVNLGARGLLADWLLPLVPAVVGALAHQIGMLYERLGTTRKTEGPAKGPAKPEPAVPAAGSPSSVIPKTLPPTSAIPASVPAAPTSAAPVSPAVDVPATSDAVAASRAPAASGAVPASVVARAAGAPRVGAAASASAASAPPATTVNGNTVSAATAAVGVAPSADGSVPTDAPAAAAAVAPDPAAGPAAVPAAVKRRTALFAPPMVAHGLVPEKAARKVLPPMPASLALLELAEAVRAEAAQARRDSRRAVEPATAPADLAAVAGSPAHAQPAEAVRAEAVRAEAAQARRVAEPASVAVGPADLGAVVGSAEAMAVAPVSPVVGHAVINLAVTRTVPATPMAGDGIDSGAVEPQTIAVASDGLTASNPGRPGGRPAGRPKVAA